MVQSVSDALLEFNKNDSVQAIIMTGVGDIFCGGVDTSRMDPARPTQMAEALVRLFRLLPKLEIPVIVAANGDALASGFALVCAADISIGTKGTVLGTYEASANLWPAIAQVPVLHRLEARHAFENILTGHPFTAERALQIGAVNQLVDREALESTATTWALAASASGFTRTGRPSAHRFRELPYDEALGESLELFIKLIKGNSTDKKDLTQ
jgi:enoyl-CoA hydratase/carnithine racemase